MIRWLSGMLARAWTWETRAWENGAQCPTVDPPPVPKTWYEEFGKPLQRMADNLEKKGVKLEDIIAGRYGK